MEKIKKTHLPLEKFEKTVKLLSILVPVKDLTKKIKESPLVKEVMYKRYNMKVIIDCGNKEYRRVLLKEEYQKIEDLSEEVRKELQDYLKSSEIYEVKLTYENYDAHEALKELIPSGAQIPTGYEMVGTILHFNLSEDMLPYKDLIGQVYLDKIKGARTVVRKVDRIENVFRFYQMEVLAGEANFVTQQREHSCVFELDLSKMYWCSRLSTERKRMADLIPESSVMLDMFCGVGPLSIKLAKERKCKVLANDLNPDCYVYLKKNIALNKVSSLVLPYNMDAREFARFVVKESNIEKSIPSTFLHFDHAYMNLPMDAVEFLDVFCGLFNEANKKYWDADRLPIIHVYAFAKEESPAEAIVSILARVNKIFGKYKDLLQSEVINFHQIRDISSISHMYALSFKLSKEVAYAPVFLQKKHTLETEPKLPSPKRTKLEQFSNNLIN